MKVHYSKSESGGRLTGFFNDSGIGVLEVSEYEVMDMVSPFIGAIADRFCGLDCGFVTEVFTPYVDVINLMYRRRRRPGWTKNEFQQL